MKKKTEKWWKAGAVGVICLAAAWYYYTESGWERQAGGLEKEAVFFLEEEDGLPGTGGNAGGSAVKSGLERDGSTGGSAVKSGLEGDGSTGGNGPETGVKASEEFLEPEKAEKIWIHVCGQVVSPGVYELAPGSRVYEAIEAAGGLLEEAADDALNMAMELTDGQQLRVPTIEEAQAAGGIFDPGSLKGAEAVSGAGGFGDGRVNLNTAGKEELMQLSGIGEARAEAIMAYRTEHGKFQRIEDIMKVSGIKEAAFEKIRDDITV